MIFDLKDLEIQLLKKFDGTHNYFNPSHFNGRTILRRESKFDDKLLVSDIVDDQDVVLLQHNTDDTYMWSYEDARFINESEESESFGRIVFFRAILEFFKFGLVLRCITNLL